jgi:hypothetical protein
MKPGTDSAPQSRTLERRDLQSGRWILYESEAEHSDDCAKYPFERLPSWIFLDTNVINLLVKYADVVFERGPFPDGLPTSRAQDIEALMHLLAAGQRANWTITTSPKAVHELGQTTNPTLRASLLDYGENFLATHEVNYAHSIDLGRRSAGASFLAVLPDVADRELLGNAIGLGCDAFCTADRSTIVKFRDKLTPLPLKILTPVEWWRHFKPWAGLFL